MPNLKFGVNLKGYYMLSFTFELIQGRLNPACMVKVGELKMAQSK